MRKIAKGTYLENYVKELVEMNLLVDIFGSLFSMITNWKNQRTSKSFEAQFISTFFLNALFSLPVVSKSIHMYLNKSIQVLEIIILLYII